MQTTVLLAKVFSTVFPLVVIVAFGYFYARKIPTDMAVTNRINIDIFVPSLIFSVISAKSFDLVKYQSLALAAAIVIFGSGLILLPICRLLKFDLKTFLPPMMFSNSGNLGIPLMILAFGDEALPAAVVLFIVENGLHFTAGLYVLDRKTKLFNVLKMPMIAATIAGLLVSSLGITIPQLIALPIDMLGQISFILLLFSLGVRMTQVDFSAWKIGLWGAILAPLSGLAIALIVQFFIKLPQQQYVYLLLFATLPPAVLNYMLAERYNQEPQKVASIVLIGNMFSIITIPITLFFIL